MNTYSIDTDVIDKFIEQFQGIYQNFMDFGGIIYNDTDKIVRLTKLFYACAICHNMNWDFLCKTAIPQLYEDTKGFSYSEVCKMDEEAFEYIFRDYPKKHKIEATTRLQMLRKLSKHICDENAGIFEQILKISSVGGDCGLSNTINTLPVFEDDPLHKKGNLLIQILLREGLVIVDDEYNVDPSIDYHVIRFFLRNGFIKFSDKATINRLVNGESFELQEITELRMTISDCMKYIYKYANISIAKLGFIAWTVGRDYCRGDYVDCEHEKSCPMIRTCKGNIDKTYRMLKEPESNVGFY